VSLTLRPARPGDQAAIMQLIEALASYERLADAVQATADDIAAALFGASPRVFCDLAEVDGAVAGFALWFYTFSTFNGRHGLWLEDLFVKPEARGAGVGRALLTRLAQRCVAEGLGRFEWSVLDWNEPAIGFYEAQGARVLTEWSICRVDGEALIRLAAKAAP
jgi:GNAT superfamily N-acetyltransferase